MFFFVYIIKKEFSDFIKKKFVDFIKKKFVDFQNFQKSNFWWRQIFENLIIHKPSTWSHARSRKKFGPDRSSRFDLYWIQTNRQTDKPNLYIEVELKKIVNSRYQIWSRLEENGHINMKILPSQIEFTLPSPKVTKEDFFLLVNIFFFFF